MRKRGKRGPSGIYVIEHTRTGRVYVGQSNDTGQRRIAHYWALHRHKHQCPLLQEAFDQDGPDGLEFRVVELVSDSVERDAAELRWLSHSSGVGVLERVMHLALPVGLGHGDTSPQDLPE